MCGVRAENLHLVELVLGLLVEVERWGHCFREGGQTLEEVEKRHCISPLVDSVDLSSVLQRKFELHDCLAK